MLSSIAFASAIFPLSIKEPFLILKLSISFTMLSTVLSCFIFLYKLNPNIPTLIRIRAEVIIIRIIAANLLFLTLKRDIETDLFFISSICSIISFDSG